MVDFRIASYTIKVINGVSPPHHEPACLARPEGRNFPLVGMLKKATSGVLALVPCSRTESTLRASQVLRPCWADFFEHFLPLMMSVSLRGGMGHRREIFNGPSIEDAEWKGAKGTMSRKLTVGFHTNLDQGLECNYRFFVVFQEPKK